MSAARVVGRKVAFYLTAIAVGVIGGVLLSAGQDDTLTAVPQAAPTYAEFTPELARQYPSCIAEPDYRGPAQFVPSSVLVQPYGHPAQAVRPLPFDRMWDQNHDGDKVNDWHVLGVCRDERGSQSPIVRDVRP